jgi:hypothetical protein
VLLRKGGLRVRRLSPTVHSVWTPLTLWGLFVANAVLLPGAIWLPQYVNAISATATRMTSVTAIFALCILGFLRPRRWILAGGIACATIFFSFQYQDTGKLNRMEQQAETLVSTLPYGSRVSYALELSEPSRVNLRHFVDRVCIGKCFAYSNYSVAAVEDAAAWETTMNSNDFPSALNFILFLSSVNWIDVFNGMMV